ncbi:MAG: nitroreductase family protein [Deltaproteobacteria bacterium]
MPARNQAALDFLLTRRSRPLKTIVLPVPTDDELQEILTAGVRVPDHGKLEPWRIVVIKRPALERMARAVVERGNAKGLEEWKVRGASDVYTDGQLCLCVISSPNREAKHPLSEQVLSSANVCLSLVNAAMAAGWAAAWMSGWPTHDVEFATEIFGLKDGETVAGLVFVGSESSAPPDRPRPDLSRIVSWIEA